MCQHKINAAAFKRGNTILTGSEAGSFLLVITTTPMLAMDLERSLPIITLLEQKAISDLKVWIV